MDRRRTLKLFAGLALCPFCAPRSAVADVHWGYEGSEGPTRWGDLDPANRACSIGSEQSPLDLRDSIPARLPPLKLTWSKRTDTIINNGHTIQLNCSGDSALDVAGASYRLVQFHFHRPSEHLVNGKSFPMEVHFVHADAAGNLAVVGVFVATGRSNTMFNRIVSTMPEKAGPAVKSDASIDPNGLLPVRHGYFRYSGSLTSPPCSETATWFVLTDPVQVAEADVARFAALYPMNARPVQRAKRRFLLRSG